MMLHFKAQMFGSLTNGGHLQVYVCEEDPELVISKIKKDRRSQWKEEITYKGEVCKDMEEAKAKMSGIQTQLPIEVL